MRNRRSRPSTERSQVEGARASHAALGRPEDALCHARAAVRHVQHRSDSGTELAAAYDIVATCHHEFGQPDAATTARRSAINVLERTTPGRQPARWRS
jgi:hypothetical protein